MWNIKMNKFGNDVFVLIGVRVCLQIFCCCNQALYSRSSSGSDWPEVKSFEFRLSPLLALPVGNCVVDDSNSPWASKIEFILILIYKVKWKEHSPNLSNASNVLVLVHPFLLPHLFPVFVFFACWFLFGLDCCSPILAVDWIAKEGCLTVAEMTCQVSY